jgi:hypothetical protein
MPPAIESSQCWLGNIPGTMCPTVLSNYFVELGLPRPTQIKLFDPTGTDKGERFGILTFVNEAVASTVLSSQIAWPSGRHACVRHGA